MIHQHERMSPQGRLMRAAIKAGVAAAPLALAAALTAPDLAAAQSAPNPPAAAAPAEAGVVVVTGSRISRRDFQAESPISTISNDTIAAAAQPSLDRVIGEIPQFEAAQGASEVGDVQGSVGFGGGASYSDLRGVGRNRSLVLMDGRRLTPSTPDGAIDLNTIPMGMIENVEVITGGASATYGSDAVAGVANFKLRQKFNGVELNIQHGSSFKNDGDTNQIGVLAGGKIGDDKGNVLVDFEYSRRDAVSGANRSFFTQPSVRFLGRPPEGIVFRGGWGNGSQNPTISAVNAVLAGYPGTTPISGSGAYTGAIGVNTDGTLYTSAAGGNCAQNYKGAHAVVGAIVSPNCATAGVVLGNYFAVQVPLTKYNAFMKADYEFNAHVKGYAQFGFSESTALDQTSPGSTKTSASASQVLRIPVSNPFVQANPALLSLINSAYGGSVPANANLYYSKLLFGWGNRVQNFKYDVWQALAGLKGDIPGTRFTWDAYASFGRSSYAAVANGDISISAINSILAGTNTASGCSGAAAWNPFGLQPVSKGCLAYAGRTDHTTDVLNAKNAEVSLEGPLFNLPAGEVRVAVGADYRDSNYSYSPDSLFVSGDSLAYGSDTPSAGSQKAVEMFGEVLAPVMKNQPLIQDLSVDLGYRYSKYNSFSAKDTWKADLNWTVVEGVRVRGGYSVAIRAPSLADLYVGKSISNTNVTLDPCDILSPARTGANAAQVKALCAAQAAAAGTNSYSYNGAVVSIPVQSGGNSLLKPETADTWSVGVVLNPIRGLNVSVDYYNINITGAIASLSSGQILADCYGASTNPGFSAANAFCQRVQRDASTGTISLLTSGTFNFNNIKLDGVDTQVNYKFGLDRVGLPESWGAMELNAVLSYLGTYTVTPADGSGAVKYAGKISDTLVTSDGENLYSHPKWKANSALTYRNGPLSGSLRWRYIGKMANLDDPTQPAPAVSYFDVDGHYRLSNGVTLSAGVNNIVDKKPPYIGTLELRTDAATYDVIGRTWFVAVKAKF